jgi:hypothetical protein
MAANANGDPGKLLYVAETNNGYAFRKSMDFLKGDKKEKTPKMINLVFNKCGLAYYSSTDIERIKISIPMLKWVRYDIDFEGDLVVGVSLDELTKGLKACKKGHHLTFYQYEKYAAMVCQVGSGASRNSEDNFPCQLYSGIPQALVENRQKDFKYHLTVALNEFSEAVKALRDANPEYVNITFCNGKLCMSAMNNGVSLRTRDLGYLPAMSATPHNIRMGIASIKALGKLSAVSAPGIVIITAKVEGELDIVIPIGVIGKLWLTYKDLQRI